jgi:hypothetical protein
MKIIKEGICENTLPVLYLSYIFNKLFKNIIHSRPTASGPRKFLKYYARFLGQSSRDKFLNC